MDIKSFDLRSRLAADAGENSIMQTITIAVSAILIAAGLVTAPGLINNARDNNARTDLANIAFAQEFTLGNTGSYAATVAAIATSTAQVTAEGGSGPVLTRSGGVSVLLESAGNSYDIYAVSQSGNVFKRSSGSGETTLVATTTAGLEGGTALAAATFTLAGDGVAADVTALEAAVAGDWE